MFKSIKFKLSGLSPLVVHSGQTVDPLNKWAKAMSVISKKRGKTDADLIERSRIEYMAALYLDKEGCPIVPAENIEAMLVASAKKQKSGKEFRAAIMVPAAPKIKYNGPKTPDELVENDEYREVRNMRVGQARVPRTLPRFPSWSMDVEVQYREDVVTSDNVIEAMSRAGSIIGLGEYRPQCGRFEAKVV